MKVLSKDCLVKEERSFDIEMSIVLRLFPLNYEFKFSVGILRSNVRLAFGDMIFLVCNPKDCLCVVHILSLVLGTSTSMKS